jgi:hypothetical protein
MALDPYSESGSTRGELMIAKDPEANPILRAGLRKPLQRLGLGRCRAASLSAIRHACVARLPQGISDWVGLCAQSTG